MEEINLTYEGVVRSKKNSKQIITNPRTGRPMITSSKQAHEMELEMVWSFIDQAQRKGWEARTPDQCEGKEYVIEIAIWQKDNRRHDLDNQATSILDALVKAFIIPDDSVKFVGRITVDNMGVEKSNPRAEIKVLEY